MTKLLPQNFPPTTPTSIASYSYTDIASGTGIVTFYGAVTQDNTTEDYILTTTPLYSNNVTVSGGPLAGETPWGELMNKDFDVSFNLPQTLRGTAYLSVSIGGNGAGAGGGVPNFKISGASIIHYDGTTETTLATASSETLVFAANDSTEGKTMLIPFSLTEKFFRKGDILRLTMSFWGRTTGTAGVSNYGFGADPADRDDPDTVTTILDALTTKLELHVPFRIDVGQ